MNCYGPGHENLENWKGTSLFISIICNWWNTVNIHHPFKGRNTRNSNAEPFCSVDDICFRFLEQLVEWLDCWALCDKQTKEGFLRSDTFAFRHTVKNLVELLKHLLVTMNVDFVLTRKFQTDNLESRLGHYRQMSDGNRLVSIQEILESETKIKINNVLKLYAADREITIKDFL